MPDTAHQIPSAAARLTQGLAAPAPQAAVILNAADRAAVAWSKLHRSPLNPRRHFGDSLTTLAESIAANGVLQNLTVRPHPTKKDEYEIVSGESRHRAVEILITAGRATPAYVMPILVQDLDDTEVLEIAMAENMARRDLTPMEEARGLAALKKRGVTTAAMAEKLGCTQRHIQQRLALVEKGAPEVQKALDEGKISVTQARALLLAPAKGQVGVLKEITKGERWVQTEEDIKRKITGEMYPVSQAIFDRKAYTGEIIKDEDTNVEYFSDAKLFEKLQLEAVEAKRAELAKTHAWAKVFNNKKGQHFHEWDYTKKVNDKSGGAAIEVNWHFEVTIHTHLVPKQKAAAASGAAGGAGKSKPAKADPEDAFTTSHRVHAHIRKTKALQRAVMNDAVCAQRLLCAALLIEDGFSPLNIAPKHYSAAGRFQDYKEPYAAPELESGLARMLEGCPGVAIGKKGGFSEADAKDAAAVWTWLNTQGQAQIARLLAALVADHVGTWCTREYGSGVPLEDSAEAVALAEALGMVGNEEKHGLLLEREDLNGLRKPALIGIRAALGADEPGTEPAEAIADKVMGMPEAKGRVLPSLRFASDMSKALQLAKITKPMPQAEPKPKTNKAAKKGKK